MLFRAKIISKTLIFIILIVKGSFASQFNHGFSIFGDIKYDKNFENFDYVNPKAPKKGHIKFGVEGTFNSLNQYILKGISGAGLSYLHDTLMVKSDDEISSYYGLVAKSVKLSSDRKSIEFILRDFAKFHDGKKITADDVIFSYNILIDKGHPSYKMSFRDVANVKKINDYHVKFTFKNSNNRDLPNLISSLPILPKHYYQNHEFDKTTLDFPLGSGPYKIIDVKPNKSITYQRVNDYWAKNLPVNKGLYNFDKITYDYYRDITVLVEAFKAQKYDVRLENVARNWANSYNIDAVKNGEIIKQEINHNLPAPIQAFIINMRKEKFQNIELRKALNLAFDFQWLKKHIFYNSYNRTKSYFPNTKFGLIENLPLEEISKYDFFIKETNGSGFNRENLIKAQEILRKAGYKIEDNKLIDPQTQKQLKIEFLNLSPSFVMIISPFIKNLKKLGIDAKIRMVEENQYKTKVNNFDYDIIVGLFGQALIPGNELYAYFHSSQKDIKGSRNLIGIADDKIDELIEKITKSQNLNELKLLCNELDKTLLENYFVVMQWYNSSFRLLYRNIFDFPKIKPKYAVGFDSWYIAK